MMLDSGLVKVKSHDGKGNYDRNSPLVTRIGETEEREAGDSEWSTVHSPGGSGLHRVNDKDCLPVFGRLVIHPFLYSPQ